MDEMLEAFRVQYERENPDGDSTRAWYKTRALFFALSLSMEAGLPAPRWAAAAFQKGAERWLSYQANTIGEAFDVERSKRKSKNLSPFPRRMEVFSRIVEAKCKGRSINKGLFEEIGADMGLSLSVVKREYRWAKDFFSRQ